MFERFVLSVLQRLSQSVCGQADATNQQSIGEIHDDKLAIPEAILFWVMLWIGVLRRAEEFRIGVMSYNIYRGGMTGNRYPRPPR